MGQEGPGGVLWHRPQVARFAKGRKLCVECVMPNVSLSTIHFDVAMCQSINLALLAVLHVPTAA